MKRYKGVFASSTDASGQTPSLTISSGIQAVIGIIGTIMVVKGVDPMIVKETAVTLNDQLNNIVAQAATMVATAYAVYHSIQMIWGVVRKFFPRVPELPDFGKESGNNSAA